MKCGEIYRTATRWRSCKPGFYVIVSRDFVAGSDDISTVVCVPIYGLIRALQLA